MLLGSIKDYIWAWHRQGVRKKRKRCGTAPFCLYLASVGTKKLNCLCGREIKYTEADNIFLSNIWFWVKVAMEKVQCLL